MFVQGIDARSYRLGVIQGFECGEFVGTALSDDLRDKRLWASLRGEQEHLGFGRVRDRLDLRLRQVP